MTATSVPPRPRANSSPPELEEISRARRIVDRLGGRFSLELDIDVDHGAGEVDRWALAATVIGELSPTSVAVDAYRTLERTGVATFADLLASGSGQLVRALDEAGCLHYAESMASGLLGLAEAVRDRHPDGLAALGKEIPDPVELERELCALPGWSQAIVRTFLRELRGVWAGADVPLDPRTAAAARHVDISADLHGLAVLATAAHLDLRDLETALMRLALSHDTTNCPGGEECPLAEADREDYVHF
jgi:hypothetical protein